MSGIEFKAVSSLTLVFVFRMLGLFMVLPVLVLYAKDMPGYTPAMAGLAIGAYGFSQALLQIPFGWLSDRVGRKPIILFGLVVFLIGSVVAAQAETMNWIIGGRVLQGCGAIAGAITALMADLTREQYRARAMAMIGIGIGIAFCLAMIIGPVVGHWWGLSGLFNTNAVMGLTAILIVLFLVPSPVVTRKDLNTAVKARDIQTILTNSQLTRHFFGIFALHFSLMSLFVFVPEFLTDNAGIPREQHGWLYLIVMVASFVSIIPLIIYSERSRSLKQFYVLGIIIIMAAIVSMGLGRHSSVRVLGGLFLFFIAFNFLEATLPSLVSKLSKAGTRGTSMGMYSTCQFLGAALGGAMGGWALQHAGIIGVMITCAVPTTLWLILSITMKQPPYVSSLVMALNSDTVPVGQPMDATHARSIGDQLTKIRGVEEVTVLPEEKTAYIKVNKRTLDFPALHQFGKC
ncbi:MFS transporter [Candidatus Sororendozoicomonas aggregata]|uniref:MFS transporter n=1 Tax=Candidatus Sororendozoicomonas aggregata TaxID=3073239 RepID=UPI002ED6A193